MCGRAFIEVGAGQGSSISVAQHTALITGPASQAGLVHPKKSTCLCPTHCQLVAEALCKNWDISKSLMLHWQAAELHNTETPAPAGLEMFPLLDQHLGFLGSRVRIEGEVGGA